jgi:ribonuclease HI
MRKDESKCAYQTMSLFGDEPKPAAARLVPRPRAARTAVDPVTSGDIGAAVAPIVPDAPVAPVTPVAPVIDGTRKALRAEIYFDGGCLGNPGKKYGSFQVKLDGREILKRSRVQFGFGTNNEAEFNALKLALDEASAWFQTQGVDMGSLSLVVETDSTIVRNRLVVKNVIFKKYPSSQRMFALANECLAVMGQFGKFQVNWKGRSSNVQRFGH